MYQRWAKAAGPLRLWQEDPFDISAWHRGDEGS